MDCTSAKNFTKLPVGFTIYFELHIAFCCALKIEETLLWVCCAFEAQRTEIHARLPLLKFSFFFMLLHRRESVLKPFTSVSMNAS
mmetsp:Transcript_15509/g.39705  ORF Transcript_15509/g.39705 Transcript_15509/m.39705 type:complete len:85 (-) Transcript_15509:16-270(-)